MAMQLQDMGTRGASIVAALAHANAAQFARIIGAWLHARGEAANTAAAIGKLYAAAQQAAGDYWMTFHIQTLGNVPGGGFVGRKAEGGMVNYAGGGTPPTVLELTRPTMIAPGVQAGEGGREFVLPANARGAMWIKDAVRQGVVEAGIDGNGGAAPIVMVYLDGRDVTGSMHRMEVLRGVKS
jgi:hypothetical protein